MLTSVIVLASYCAQAIERYQSGALSDHSLRDWAGLMLTYVGIGIVVAIVIQIAFAIIYAIAIAVKAKSANAETEDKEIERKISQEFVEDERDKLIELKSTQVEFTIAGIGFVAGLGFMYFQGSAALMLNIMFISFQVSGIVEAVVQFHLHRVS